MQQLSNLWTGCRIYPGTPAPPKKDEMNAIIQKTVCNNLEICGQGAGLTPAPRHHPKKMKLMQLFKKLHATT